MSDELWWQSFFDEDYIEAWSGLHPAELCEKEASELWDLLDLEVGDRVLDAPCGYGRMTIPFARRGAAITGVDYSNAMLTEARRRNEALEPPSRARFIEADLREPLADGGFDAAINLFSSLGYGSEQDDRAMLSTTRRALSAEGQLFVDTLHRDVVIARLARGQSAGARLPGGGLLRESVELDPIGGVVSTRWTWTGPVDTVEKNGHVRCYTITELIALAESCDFRFVSAHQGCSASRFESRPTDGGGRVGLLFRCA